MTFMHKLSCRLALLKDRVVAVSPALLAAAVVFACERRSSSPIQEADGLRVVWAPHYQREVTPDGDQAVASRAPGHRRRGRDLERDDRQHHGYEHQAAATTGSTRRARTQAGEGHCPGSGEQLGGHRDGGGDPAAGCFGERQSSSPACCPAQTVQLTATTLDSTGAALTGDGDLVEQQHGRGDGERKRAGHRRGRRFDRRYAASEGRSASSSVTVTTVPVAS